MTAALRAAALLCVLMAGIAPTAAAAVACASVVDPDAALGPSSRLDGAVAALGRLDVTVLVTAVEPALQRGTRCGTPGRHDVVVRYDPASRTTRLSTALVLRPGLRDQVDDTMRSGLQATDPASAIAQGLEQMWQSLERSAAQDNTPPSAGEVAAVPDPLRQHERRAATRDPVSGLLGAARRLVAVTAAISASVAACALAGMLVRRRQERHAERRHAQAARQLLAESYFDLDARMAEVAMVDGHQCTGPSVRPHAMPTAASARVAAVRRAANDVELILLRPELEVDAAACDRARMQLESALEQLAQLAPANG